MCEALPLLVVGQFHVKVNQEVEIAFDRLVVPLLTAIGMGSPQVPTLGLRSIKTASRMGQKVTIGTIAQIHFDFFIGPPMITVLK